MKQIERFGFAQRATKHGASTSRAGVPVEVSRIGVCGREVQPTLEPAEPLCRAVQAAGSLYSRLAKAPGPDPESASSSP